MLTILSVALAADSSSAANVYRHRARLLANASWSENNCTVTQVAFKFPTVNDAGEEGSEDFLLVTAAADCIDKEEQGRDWFVCESENVQIAFSPHCVTTRPVLEVNVQALTPQIGDVIVAYASGDAAGAEPDVHLGTLWVGTLGAANSTSFAFSASGHQMSLMRGAPAVSLCGGFGIVTSDSQTLELPGVFALAAHHRALADCIGKMNQTCDMPDAVRLAIPAEACDE